MQDRHHLKRGRQLQNKLFILLILLSLVVPVVAQSVVQDTAALLQSDTITPHTKSNAIDARVEYTSTDSMVIMGNGIAHMYGAGDVKYKNMELSAEYIRIHMDSSTLYAQGVLDTIENEWIGKPVFVEGEDSYETDEITYNLRTQKGLILNANFIY